MVEPISLVCIVIGLRAARSADRISADTRHFCPSPRGPYGLWDTLIGVLSPEVNRPGREVHLSPPSSCETKNVWSCTSTPFMCPHGVGKNNFNFG